MLRKQAHRANRVNLGEGGLRIAETPGSEVEEIVALVFETVQVPTLITSLVGAINSKGFMFFNVRKPTTQIRSQQISSNEVPYPYPTARHRPKPLGGHLTITVTISSPHSHQRHVSLYNICIAVIVSWWVFLLLPGIGRDRDALEAGCGSHCLAVLLNCFTKFLIHKEDGDSW